MVWDPHAQALVEAYGLHILNVTWEDTGRYYDSSVGPNISDVTIQVQHKNPRTGDYELTLMPVIRYPNFHDLSAEVLYLLEARSRVLDGSFRHPRVVEYHKLAFP